MSFHRLSWALREGDAVTAGILLAFNPKFWTDYGEQGTLRKALESCKADITAISNLTRNLVFYTGILRD